MGEGYSANPALGQNLEIQGLGSPLLNEKYIDKIQELGKAPKNGSYKGIKIKTVANTKERFFELLYLVVCNGNKKGYKKGSGFFGRNGDFSLTNAMKNKKFANLMGEFKYSKDVMTINAANNNLKGIKDSEWEELLSVEVIAGPEGLLSKLHNLNVLSEDRKKFYEKVVGKKNKKRLKAVIKTLSKLPKEKRTSRNIIKHLDNLSKRSYVKRGVGRIVTALFIASVAPLRFVGKIPSGAKFLFNKTTGGIKRALFEVNLPDGNPSSRRLKKLKEETIKSGEVLIRAIERGDETMATEAGDELLSVAEEVGNIRESSEDVAEESTDEYRNNISNGNNGLFREIKNGRYLPPDLRNAYDGNMTGLNLPFWHTDIKQGRDRSMVTLEKGFIRISKSFDVKDYSGEFKTYQSYITKLTEIYKSAKKLKAGTIGSPSGVATGMSINAYRNDILRRNNGLFEKINDNGTLPSNLKSIYNAGMDGLNLPFWHTSIGQGNDERMRSLEVDFISVSSGFNSDPSSAKADLTTIYEEAKRLKI
jgi:hypothetical protein